MEETFEGVFGFENHEELINEMMSEYGQDILRLVYSYVNNKEVAEDLTQDIFVKFYKSLHTFKGKSKLKTWLWRIAINHCKDFLKSWYTKHVSIAEDTTYIKTKKEMVEEVIIQKEAEDQLISAIMSLPIKYREVIYLYYYEELLIKEIAVLTEVSVNTVKTRIRRAKELLEERLEER
ncbi:sigma-70 family RNA polymerase sigma factor [Bacillus sp. FJAT-22090]|uniref:sigma-70 family RNA polymerase sigma factor n=1 Tax=Bacillus sp. FJAT-22090 TaxID=1581038 RepID=UPI0021B1C1B2|nr:sigma-70 family RNA polymerase sigma factor [Bacillus sp. FJAT-22090]